MVWSANFSQEKIFISKKDRGEGNFCCSRNFNGYLESKLGDYEDQRGGCGYMELGLRKGKGFWSFFRS